MTLQEMIVEAHDQLGMPSDLWPYTAGTTTFDITVAGSLKLIQWLNRGYRYLANWKFPNGHLLRFKSLSKTAYFTLDYLTAAADATLSNTRTIQISSLALSDGTGWTQPATDALKGFIVEVTSGTLLGEKAVILSSVVASGLCTLNKALSANLTSGDTVKLYRADWPIVATTASADARAVGIALDDLVAIQRITDSENNTSMVTPGRTDPLSAGFTDTGDPTTFWRSSSGIKFNVAPSSKRTYWIEYFALPETLSTAAQVPVIPAPWHEVIVMWAVWWGMRRQQDWKAQYATMKAMDDIIMRMKQESEAGLDYEDFTLEIVL